MYLFMYLLIYFLIILLFLFELLCLKGGGVGRRLGVSGFGVGFGGVLGCWGRRLACRGAESP